ncbi:membrane protease subunit (stomatin/prohibitin family) [Lachnotalea glycerini]|uniref:Membrane protease subunit (Stomatin/prohibitin family) n=1 Tax=Lachnotalea glycerini TaxID=1763509 RepID=A0A318EU24_9FIRM|nr:SPFH domain-containing protein [Lachnotalea glycerini]PXV87867.1 membrane protease subunit (stomatin/prohibitin family) [Lachnotalea glycerini]
MGLFGGQLSNVVEWEEYRDDVIFWKWNNSEIKRGSKLIIRQGQDAIFMYNGKVEGIFTEEGSFDIESDIIPFLSTLKGFKFGFNSGMRAEVLFINTKEFTINWGTKNAINIPAHGLPGGMPIRAFGNFNSKVNDQAVLIEKIAGIKKQFTVDEIKERVIAALNQLLMKWIMKCGKDMFHLQSDAYEIARGICEDLDMEMCKIGIGITGFFIESFSYPEEIQKLAEKAASQSMVTDTAKYTQIAMADGMQNENKGTNMALDMAGLQMGMMMGQQMVNQMQSQTGHNSSGKVELNTDTNKAVPNFCPNCGAKTNGTNFCSNCGTKLI